MYPTQQAVEILFVQRRKESGRRDDPHARAAFHRRPLQLQALVRIGEPQQHAAAVLPVQIDAKKNASVGASGLYLQVAAFANPDAAELLKAKLSETVAAPVFVSSVVRNQQILHRVRLGPVSSQSEAEQLQSSVRLANLGEPTLVKPD